MKVNKNKVACIHITQSRINILEGKIDSGIMLVSRTASVEKASRFFAGTHLAYMSEMVSAVINAMTINSFTANNLYIVYDNNLEVDFYLNENLTASRRESALTTSGLDEILKKLQGKADNGNDAMKPIAKEKNSGVIRHRKAWGAYITESEQGELYTTVSIARDLVDYLVAEFQTHGYIVRSVEAPETAMMYLRKTVPFTYDSLHKIILHADTEERVELFQFTKDMPSGHRQVGLDMRMSDNFGGACIDLLLEEIQKKHLRNPVIILTGDAFSNEDFYRDLCEEMFQEGLNVIDLYKLWNGKSQNPHRLITAVPTDGLSIQLNSQFGICVAALMRVLEPKPENLVEGFHPTFIKKETLFDLCSLTKSAAAVFAIYAIMMLGVSVYENRVASTEYNSAARTTSQHLTLAERERDTAKEKLEALKTIDNRYSEVFKFVYSQVNNDLNIASVDTQDMIPSATVETEQNTGRQSSGGLSSIFSLGETNNDAEGEKVEAVETAASRYSPQTIVIRGYSRLSDGPIELYRKLTSAGLGEVKISGIEQVLVPSGESIFAFEMTVGNTN